MRPFPRFNPQININVPQHYAGILEKYRDYSMIARKPDLFYENMLLMDFIGRVLPGDFVECGTWRGGMSCARMAVGGNNRDYHFFDSFEGLPEPQQLDGQRAFDYQKILHPLITTTTAGRITANSSISLTHRTRRRRGSISTRGGSKKHSASIPLLRSPY